MNEEEFFEWLATYCRENNYGALTAQTVMHMAARKGIELGSIFYVGRRYLIPHGWKQAHTTSGQSIYLPPERILPLEPEFDGVRRLNEILRG